MRNNQGFTIVELMIVVAMLAALVLVALPSYTDFVNKSRARTAAADLMALTTVLENNFQRNLSYAGVVTESTTAGLMSRYTTWNPAQSDYFGYSLVGGTNYVLTATGQNALAGCNLTVNAAGTRSATDACNVGANW